MLRTFGVQRATRPNDASRPPATGARDAATVMLLRDGPAGVEVFMMRRVTGMAFAGGMHVFPGGGLDPRDEQPCPWQGPAGPALATALGTVAPRAEALVVAAVRETFEEVGVLLASPPGGAPASDVGSPAWESEREGLAAGRTGLADVLDRHGLVLRADLLRPWAHWLTPDFEPRRFDTRFFAAAIPPGQHARHVGGEAADAAWVGAAAALEGYRDGQVAMLPPTVVCLEEVAAAPDVATLLRTPRSPRRVTPWLGTGEDGETVLCVDLDGRGGGEPR